MTELHLDLCIQSTAHLLETVSNIKENVRMLEVFLNSGLQMVDFSDSLGLKIPNDGFPSYTKSESKGYSSLDSRLYQYLSHKSSNGIRHLNCCCMCSGRIQQGSGGPGGLKNCQSGTISRTSCTTGSNSSNTNSSRKKAHITPRLNKTASLRRAKVLQKISSSSRN